MSVRQRVPFKFVDDKDALDEQGPVLDEQEQEELIQDLKDASKTHNAQYIVLFQVVIGLSALLHIVYLFNPSKQSPLAAIFPTTDSEASTRRLPLTTYFTLMHMFLHVDLSMHLLPPPNPIRSFISSTTNNAIPASYAVIFSLSAAAPVVALFMRLSWLDTAWWSTALMLTWFIYSGEKWMRDEEEALQKLETLRYDARGA